MEKQSIYGFCLGVAALLAASAFGAAVWYRQENAQLRQMMSEPEAGRHPAEAAASAEKTAPLPGGRDASASDREGEIAALNAYIDKLEATNRAYRQQLENIGDASRAEGDGPRGRRRGGPFNLEELKERDPEEYERVRKRMDEMRKWHEERNAERAAYLNAVSANLQDAEQREVLKSYQEMLKELDQLRQDPQTSQEEMRDAMRRVMEVRNQVSDILYEQLAVRLNASVDDLRSEIDQINDATSRMWGPPPMPPR